LKSRFRWLGDAGGTGLTYCSNPYWPETESVSHRLSELKTRLDWPQAAAVARQWVQQVRDHPAPFWALESLLKEYPISSAEGLALMRLAEALLRVPDTETAIALTSDQLGRAEFNNSDGMAATLSASAIAWSKKFLPETSAPVEPASVGDRDSLIQRFGAKTVVAATIRGIQLLGQQFVLGRNIEAAMHQANAQRSQHKALVFSYDMLGEGARTEADAERYLTAYRHAIEHLGQTQSISEPECSDGISIKLSALFSRYEEAQRERVFKILTPRVQGLMQLAAHHNLNLTIDAEESDRLELSLSLFDHWLSLAPTGWKGFGLAVQAYQHRAAEVVSVVSDLARQHQRRLMVRLVKGAYWDAEIKRAQEMGVLGYPVYTHKHHTDISYLACAARLLEAAPHVYPQFATHNAGTIAAILQMARATGTAFEMQRLHGMGEGVYREVLKDKTIRCRVYAPVGEHRGLLAYLVRRLLENGANSSFVHQLADETVDMEALLRSPLHVSPQPALATPIDLYGATRKNSSGMDLSVAANRDKLQLAWTVTEVAEAPTATLDTVAQTMQQLGRGFTRWNGTPVQQRAHILRKAAEVLEQRLPQFCALLVKEAGKTWGDAVAEVREAVDFCRYYADEAERLAAPQTLPGPTGESNTLSWHGRGVWVCISPWNFPLAIFCGQVVAALAMGNTVAAKPAEQTPAVAQQLVQLLRECGMPDNALHLLHGSGESIGAALVVHPDCAGVAFTGSTEVAKHIARALATKPGPIVPLIAETGGINAMIVDSTALPEQVVDAVIASSFRSAGQRCSALRLLCLQEEIADSVLTMLAGAMQELVVGDPADDATDVGPVIDADAHKKLQQQIQVLAQSARLVARTPLPDSAPALCLAPVCYEIAQVSDCHEEVFGPVLQVLRWSGSQLDPLIDDINRLGYGLTLGIQTRIDSRAHYIAARARVGNIYVNRNMVGAVVGVQPFGGEGFSGTGPKAGGPHYLLRFASEKTLTINTAAAGGNAALLVSTDLADGRNSKVKH
jgi:RHH-type proline utilization regulon transcriptional repressor/proline dehydrogenase/delta 1-pyrroline-5-carboxylate dehydrogenase